MIFGKEKTRPTNLFYFMRGATITVADWPLKFFYNLNASQEFLYWLQSKIGDSQQLEALALHRLFLWRWPFLVPSTIIDSFKLTVSSSCKAPATGPALRPLQENRLVVKNAMNQSSQGTKAWKAHDAVPVFCEHLLKLNIIDRQNAQVLVQRGTASFCTQRSVHGQAIE